MRIDNIYPTPVVGDTPDKETGQMEILGYDINAQTSKDTRNGVNFNIYIPIEELKKYDMDYDKATREAIIRLLELDVTKVDAFDAEKIKRDTAKIEKDLNKSNESTSNMITELALALSNIQGGN